MHIVDIDICGGLNEKFLPCIMACLFSIGPVGDIVWGKLMNI